MEHMVLVVPTIRENCITRFLRAWGDGLPYTIVIEDNPTKTFNLSGAVPTGRQVEHYCWADIDGDLGADAWIIPRRTDCIRSYGFLKAAEAGADMIVTLDDDCFPDSNMPPEKFFTAHNEALTSSGYSCAWRSTIDGIKPRGFPYFQDSRANPTAVNVGLWTGVIDCDAPTQLLQNRWNDVFELASGTARIGEYVPMCGMNLAFSVKVLPAMYFLLMGRDYPYDRFGDIWCGVLVKRILDHLRLTMKYGQPVVRHDRASDVWKNLIKETPGLPINETFWQAVDNIILTADTIADCYLQIAEKLPYDGGYWDRLKSAMKIWTELTK